MAFSIVQRIVDDVVRGGIVIDNPNKELRDALYVRLKDVGAEESARLLMLSFFYDGQAAATFLAGEQPGVFYVPGERLNKINVALPQPMVNTSYFKQFAGPKGLYDPNHGQFVVNMGGMLYVPGPTFYYLNDDKMPLYLLIKSNCDTLEELSKGIRAASTRLGKLWAKGAATDDPTQQYATEYALDAMKRPDHEQAIATRPGEEISNVAMDMAGLTDAYQAEAYTISMKVGIQQNILLGKGQGVQASAEEDFRLWANRVEQWRELYLRGFYKNILHILINEKDTIMDQFEPEDIDFSFAPLKSETELEKADTVNREIDAIERLRNLGVPLEAAASLSHAVSGIFEESSDEHLNNENIQTGEELDENLYGQS
ncbi:MAG: DUF1073 domain-containing protein [Lachnospiraceae bacterium]|nr:DUF1073 domain-containing protein [Lachnospiraceae bacterium]